MNINIKMTKDFEHFLDSLKSKYGEDFEVLNGCHESQTNFSDFIDSFVDKNVADVTIDANANASSKDIRSLLAEKGKSIDKLFNLNKIFYELKKKYGLRTAKAWLEAEYSGKFYLHDSSSTTYLPYCYAYDLSRLASEGLFFLKNYNHEPPKHLTTFVDDVIEFISFMSNRSSGAVGIPNILVWTYYFWKTDVKNGYFNKSPEYYIRQSFQKLLYRLNQPFMRIDQSAFVNVSVFDRNYVEALFGGLEFPDGSYMIDEIEKFMDHQKTFMEVVKEVRSQNMFTFPVLTCSLLYQNGKFVDEEFARYCSDNNFDFNDYNFFQSDNVGTLSNCPLSGDTKILYWSDFYNQFISSPIKEVYHNKQGDSVKHITVLSNGKEIDCKINRFDEAPNYEIELVNGAKLKTTAEHLNKVLGKDYVKTSDLTVDDYLPISLTPYEKTKNMSYEDGKLVGMFLGDGSYRNPNDIVFSLNNETDKDDVSFIKEYCTQKYNAKCSEYVCNSIVSEDSKCSNISVVSPYLKGLIKQFVKGNNVLDKELSLSAISCSVEFRKGILDGLYKIDGENSNRIYTSSVKLKDSLVTMLASLGIPTTVSEDSREDRLGKNINYTIRWYDPKGKTQQQDVYKIEDDLFWVKIKNIRKLKTRNTSSFCLEVLSRDTEPVFMLSNGVLTHNCRLLSDTSKLDAFINSIGGTALSIGSIKVNTINLMRLAYENNEPGQFFRALKETTKLCCKTLDVIRHIITRNIEKGLLPNYCDGGIELAKQYCTVGILGLYEVIEKFGFIARDEFGNVSYTEDGIKFAAKVFEVINEVKDNFTKEYSFNVESVPAERAAVILCQKDNLLFEKHEKFIYSNQWIPLSEKCTIQEKIRLSSVLDKLASGGAIAHINLESNFANKEEAWKMLNYIASQGVFYFAFNTRINECINHHGFIGSKTCPQCGEKVHDTFQRIVGYLVPTRAYSKDRFKEFNTRKWYEIAEMMKNVTD